MRKTRMRTHICPTEHRRRDIIGVSGEEGGDIEFLSPVVRRREGRVMVMDDEKKGRRAGRRFGVRVLYSSTAKTTYAHALTPDSDKAFTCSLPPRTHTQIPLSTSLSQPAPSNTPASVRSEWRSGFDRFLLAKWPLRQGRVVIKANTVAALAHQGAVA